MPKMSASSYLVIVPPNCPCGAQPLNLSSFPSKECVFPRGGCIFSLEWSPPSTSHLIFPFLLSWALALDPKNQVGSCNPLFLSGSAKYDKIGKSIFPLSNIAKWEYHNSIFHITWCARVSLSNDNFLL